MTPTAALSAVPTADPTPTRPPYPAPSQPPYPAPYQGPYPAPSPLPPARLPWTAGLAIPILAGLAVSLGMGAYARLHPAAGVALTLPGFENPLAAKAWLTTAAFVLAIVQMVSAAGIFGRFGNVSWPAVVHRWSGRLAVLITLPVVAHCLYALGFGFDSPRILVHSLAGCLFYGAFTAKMLTLPRRSAPGWAIPLLGALVSAASRDGLAHLGLWFFVTFGLTR